MHDHHCHAGLKFFQGINVLSRPVLFQFFVVVGNAVGDFPIVAEIVQVVEYGEAGVPEGRSDGAELVYLLVGESGLFADEQVGPSGQHDGNMIFDPELEIAFQEFRCGVDCSHVGIEVGGFEAHGAGAVQLGCQFECYLIGRCVLSDVGDVGPEATGRIDQAGNGGSAGKGHPAVGIPFRGKGEVQSSVDSGVCSQPFDESGHPGAGHHHADGGSGAAGKGGDGPFIGLEAHAGVVYMQDEDAGTFGVAESFGVGGIGALRVVRGE